MLNQISFLKITIGLTCIILSCTINAQSSNKYFSLAQQQRRNNKHNEAIINYTKSIELDSTNLKAFYFRAECETNLKNFEASVNDYTHVIQKDPHYNKDIYYELANSLSDYGLEEEAIIHYNKSLEINPKLYCAYNNRGNAKSSLGMIKEALEDYTSAVAKDSKEHKKYIYVNKARTLFDLNREEEAKIDYENALNLDPYSYVTYDFRGLNELEKLDFENALNDISIALTLDERIHTNYSKANLHNARGFIFYLKGYYSEAINEYDSSILKGDKLFQPKYQYKSNAAEALKDSSKLLINHIEWEKPVGNFNGYYQGTWKTKSSSDITFEVRTISDKVINKDDIQLFQIDPVLNTKKKVTIPGLKEVSSYKEGKYYVTLLQTSIKLPIGKTQYQFEHLGSSTQKLSISKSGDDPNK